MKKTRVTSVSQKFRWLAIAALAWALSLAACGGSPQEETAKLEVVTGVRVETLQLQSVPDEIEAPGTVASVATAQIAARTMGVVQAVLVREGDLVRHGQLLIQIDDRELAARNSAGQSALSEVAAAKKVAERAVAAAQAQADVAQKTYERFRYLRDQKSVSPQEFDEVEAKYHAAMAGLEQARATQQQVEATQQRVQAEASAASTVASYSRVTAPFDGVVVRRQVEPGAMAVPGVTLLIVEDTSRYRLEVTVSAAASAVVKRGSKARVELDALPGKALEGIVSELEAGADAGSQTLKAKVDLPRDPAIRSGLFGRAWFVRGERRGLLVPQKNLLARGQLMFVYAVDAQGIARLRVVTLGRKIGEHVEILSGLGENDRIVAEPGRRELDGKKVTP